MLQDGYLKSIQRLEQSTKCTECRWFLSHARGDPHTAGRFNEAQYRYAILPEAQDPNNASACFALAPWHHA